MISVDPDEIHIEVDIDLVEDSNSESGYSVNKHWEMTIPEQGGTAYIRITPQLRDFFKLCNDKHGVIGFEYDFEEAGLNFGLILRRDDGEVEKKVLSTETVAKEPPSQ